MRCIRTTRHFQPLIALFAVAWFGAPAVAADDGLPRARPEEVGMSSERLQRLGQRMQEYVDRGQVAGVVTLVARQGKVVHLEARGYRSREEKVPMKEDDLFVIMSMTKPIASTALMMLFEEGRFLLSDPMSKWLPEFEKVQVRVADDTIGGYKLVLARPMTIRHVLTHTAGLGNQRGSAPSRDLGAAPTTLRERVRQIATYPLNFQPGERWEYGSATDVVAALVEVMSGMNMDDFLRDRIFQPLGMNDTYYNVPEAKWVRRAGVYTPEKDGSLTPRTMTKPQPTKLFAGIAGLTSTAPDYFRFHQMILNGGQLNGARLLSPKTVDLMITNHTGELPTMRGPGCGFGLGYSVLLDPGKSGESLTPGSFGWGGAWGTYFFVDPVEEMIGVIMIQLTSYGHLRIRHDLGTLAMQAIIDAKSSGTQKIRGYRPLQ